MTICIFDLDDTLYDTSERLDEKTPNFSTMKLYPEAEEILGNNFFEKILVTFGEKELQEKKIKALNISSYFKEIYICEDKKDKLNIFRKIAEGNKILDPQDVYIVGDRVDSEIYFGNLLGFNTIWVKRGKYKDRKPKDKTQVPTYELSSLEGISIILKNNNF